MPVYKAPFDEMLFLLTDVFQIARYSNLPGFAEAAPDLIEAILSEAAIDSGNVEQVLRWRRNSATSSDPTSAFWIAGASKPSAGRSWGSPSATWYLTERSGCAGI